MGSFRVPVPSQGVSREELVGNIPSLVSLRRSVFNILGGADVAVRWVLVWEAGSDWNGTSSVRRRSIGI